MTEHRLTRLQAEVLRFHETNERGSGDAGWNTSRRALVRRKLLRWEGESVLLTPAGTEALAQYREAQAAR